jgi:hypothetical protein
MIGVRAWFFGFEFALLMARLTPGVVTRFDSALYRPAGVRVVGGNVQIRFDWRSSSSGEEIVVMRA